MLTTDRLILRAWQQQDCAPFAALNADPEVMRFFPAPLTGVQSDASVDRFQAHISQYGFGFWAVQLRASGQCIGFIGIQHAPDYLACAPALEIGWRLCRSSWGQGLAPEGARAALAFAFSRLAASEVVSFTAGINKPSIRVMEKIGMRHDPSADFNHPKVPEGHPLRPHVLYRINREDCPF